MQKTEILQKRQPAWQAGNNLSDRIQVQIGSDVDAVVNDSSDPVDIEKESNQKEKYFPVRNCDFFQCPENFSKRLTDGNRSHFHVILLPILLQQRQRHHQPPKSRHAKTDHLGDKIRQHPDHIRPQHVSNQCYKKRNAGSQVSPRIAIGGYLIHTFLRRHVIQHGIVNRQRCIIADSCHNINDQKQHPARCNAIQHTSCDAKTCRCGKKDLFLILTIRQHSADRTDQCHHHRNNGNGNRIIRRRLIRTDFSRPVPIARLLNQIGISEQASNNKMPNFPHHIKPMQTPAPSDFETLLSDEEPETDHSYYNPHLLLFVMQYQCSIDFLIFKVFFV